MGPLALAAKERLRHRGRSRRILPPLRQAEIVNIIHPHQIVRQSRPRRSAGIETNNHRPPCPALPCRHTGVSHGQRLARDLGHQAPECIQAGAGFQMRTLAHQTDRRPQQCLPVDPHRDRHIAPDHRGAQLIDPAFARDIQERRTVRRGPGQARKTCQNERQKGGAQNHLGPSFRHELARRS